MILQIKHWKPVILLEAVTLIGAGLACRAASPAVGEPTAVTVTASSTQSRTPSPSLPPLTSSPTSSITLLMTASPQPAPTQDAMERFPQPTLVPAPTLTAGPSPTFPPLSRDAWCIPWNSPAVQATVLKVVDGITIEVYLDGKPQKIGYSGLDLLEFAEDWRIWEQMREANRSLVEGKTVTLIGGGPGSLTDEPRLRYVLAGSAFVNLELVQNGYAIARSTPPETSCDEVLRIAEEQAIQDRRGLWAPAPTPTRTLRPPAPTAATTGTLVIVKVAYQGTFWQEPDEFVEIFNAGTQPVQISGWSVRDAQNHAFIFPNFILGAGQYCRVMTNDYQPEHCGFSYYKPSPVWDNDGDCAYLQDSQGRLIDEFCY